MDKRAFYNVVLISIDALRADRVSCYGHSRPTTPFIDRLAAKGIRFSQAFCHQPGTWLSHTSLFTGNVQFKLPWDDLLAWQQERRLENSIYQLDESDVTLASTLRDAGYRTAGFVSGWNLDRRWGFDLGFDAYHDLRHVQNHRFFRLYWLRSKLTRRRLSWRPARITNRLVEKWLEANDSEPFFLFVHYMEPHSPYKPHPDHGDWPKYDQQVKLADDAVADLWQLLQKRNVARRTLLVVVADHGESLGERGFPANRHGWNLFEENLHVPLVMHLPGVVPPGSGYDGVVRMIDVAPTILEVLEEGIPATFDGHSLVPTFSGQTLELDHYCFIPIGHKYESIRYRPEVAPSDLEVRPLLGIRDREWKFLRFRSGVPLYRELYHLPSDPGEMNNLVDSQPLQARQLEEKLMAMQAEVEKGGFARQLQQPLDRHIEERLQDLGYLE